jgi:hypothetical protein
VGGARYGSLFGSWRSALFADIRNERGGLARRQDPGSDRAPRLDRFRVPALDRSSARADRPRIRRSRACPRHRFASAARLRRLATRGVGLVLDRFGRSTRQESRTKYVEVRGFEPLASAVRRQRSTGLSYTPGTSGSVAEGSCGFGGGGSGVGGTPSTRHTPRATSISLSSGRYSDWKRNRCTEPPIER